MRDNKIHRKIIMILVIVVCFICVDKAYADNLLQEDGTKENPYTINSAEDLLKFANSVNSGKSYEGKFLIQTCDIDLKGIEWKTIGSFDSECSFMGNYNGDGHLIKNLSVDIGGNNSFFGKLGGIVMNLGIDSGSIIGACVGGITSHSSNPNAVIINCYNRAMVRGERAGGIADNFNGTISNCWSECDLQGNSIGGIISYDAKSIINSISIENLGRSEVFHDGVEYVDKSNVNYSDVIEKLNSNIYYSAKLAGIDYHDLNFWELSKDGKQIVFSNDKACIRVRYLNNFLKTVVGSYFPIFIIISSFCLIVKVIQRT